jgi:hypothetical protein
LATTGVGSDHLAVVEADPGDPAVDPFCRRIVSTVVP